ncbi:branched-chain amino acid ABC transporter permease [Marinivivus vitaminiproducens]|uniref:branched-chain amino acid ABC transporter permease n=1 Tax=Marinivivus vitaminiproducens TaxID=3035935 RepID=UPI00279AF9ED|nr:branched-chain amino acid ABC transporter permease [Geminicoccaceae bacterium SCSIO 64248]
MATHVVTGLVRASVDLRTASRDAGIACLAMLGASAFTIIVGLFGQFVEEWLIVDVLDIGHALLAAIVLCGGMAIAAQRPGREGVVAAALAGIGTGALLAILVALARAADLRWMFISLTVPALREVAYRLDGIEAVLLLAAAGGLICALGALIRLAPDRTRGIILGAILGVVCAGLLRELFRSMLDGLGRIDRLAFSFQGMLPQGAVVAALVGGFIGARPFAALSVRARLGLGALGLVFVLALPALTNDFVAQIMLLVCLYTLMGMGLNIELGLAGLVDLGFVAFFAVGAYTMALLTGGSEQSIANLNPFVALIFCILFAAFFGFLFGLPVLKVRGDYLAIATLGLGEIIRVLVLSDMLRPVLGGAQGLVAVPKPVVFGLELGTPTQMFYLAVALTAAAGYLAWRLQHSGLGRRWTAVREDEDVAQALGINLVQIKLYAYTMGAAFAGLGGGIFAMMVGSVFPQSFQLLVSINVLAILVVGGIGSLAGVLVGAIVLIGIPEVLRDLGEYRYLIYGLTIIAVVRLRPQGLSPVRIRQREAL